MNPRSATRPAAPRRRKGLRRFVAWLVVLAMAVAVVAPVAALTSVLISARSYDTTPTDAIAVMGASQYWGEPSPIYANRLDHARDLWAQGTAPLIITVGGQQEGDITTEAEAGRQYLIRSGVPADAVVALPGGANTLQSVELVAGEMGARDLDSVTIVSDRVHLARSAAMGTALGLDTHVSGRAFADGSSFVPERIGREVAGLVKFHLWDRWFLDQPTAG